MKENNFKTTFFFFFLMKIIFGLTCILLSIVVIHSIMRDNHLSIFRKGSTLLTPTQIKSIQNIGQWEFLSISDEELVDTVRHGFFSDDELMNIYYGTLRLGIDMKDVRDGWIKRDHDTLTCTLPPIRLLDNEFIDEARTKTFYQNGHWSADDHDDLYHRAAYLMKKRCLTPDNIESARLNASDRFYNLFKSMGIQFVRIRFEKTAAPKP